MRLHRTLLLTRISSGASLAHGTTFRVGAADWPDQDQEEIILFYEFREDIEWQVEFTLEGGLKAIGAVWPALMAEAAQRESYGVSLPWPPCRD